MKANNYYQILDIPPGASDEDVRRAWRVQALRWHPDRNPADRGRAQNRIVLINRAYAILKTKPQREAYNRLLAKTAPPRPAPVRKKKRGILINLREILWPIAARQVTRHV